MRSHGLAAQPPNGLASTETPERPSKRPQLQHDTHTARSTDAENALEVDHMVLDYLAHQTTAACLANRASQVQRVTSTHQVSVEHNLSLFDGFYRLFRSRHAGYKFDMELRFRVLLVKLVVLITQRFRRSQCTPGEEELERLRAANQTRAKRWIGSVDLLPSVSYDGAAFDRGLPIAREKLERNRAHMLHELKIAAEVEALEDGFYGTPSCVTLLDVLPLFMQVSAASRAMTSSSVNELWMQMAGEFMLQACLEQYLIFGAHGTDAMDEAFAWGYHAEVAAEPNADMNEGSKVQLAEQQVNSMFEDDVYEVEVQGWTNVKMSYLSQLFQHGEKASSPNTDSVPASSDSDCGNSAVLLCSLDRASVQHPIPEFEKQLLNFLTALSGSIEKPVLVQLESGELAGMTAGETQKFLLDCGARSFSFETSALARVS